MTRETQTVWRSDDGDELVVLRNDGRLSVTPAVVNKKNALELTDALTDAVHMMPDEEKAKS